MKYNKVQVAQSLPRTYLVPAIFVTIFAFFPVGAFAIKFALQAKTKYESGDYEGAVSASRQARKLCVIGTLIAGVIYLLPLLGVSYFTWFSSADYQVVESANKTVPLNIDCHTAYRSSVTVPVQKKERMTLTSTKDKKTIRMGDLDFHTQYLSGEKNGEVESLKVSVTPAESKEELAAFLYQMPNIGQVQNQFSGVRGFTGLGYVYHPKSRAELQYWCVAR